MKRRPRRSFSLSRPGAAARLLASLLATVLVLAQGASVFHELLVPHRVCADHGHRVHGSAAEHASEVPDTGGTAALTSAADGEQEAHEHCTLPARPEQNGVSVARDARVELAPIADFTPRAEARELPHAGAPLLLVAPKQSPPRA